MKIVPVFVLAAALSLGSCASTGGGGGITSTSIQAEIAAIQQAVADVEKGGCGFLPTAETVSAILATLAPSTASIDQTIISVVQRICASVAPVKAARKLGKQIAPPTVNGVVIHGRFVR